MEGKNLAGIKCQSIGNNINETIELEFLWNELDIFET